MLGSSSDDLLAQLHDKTVRELLRKIESGEATAADLGVARALLRDNDITAKPAKGTPIYQLTERLPFVPEEPPLRDAQDG